MDPSSVRGELGKGRFQYACDSSTRACDGAFATTFPERIAVETRFDLSFAPFGSVATTTSLEPASEHLLEIRDFAWRAREPGTVGILAVLGDRSLYDYTFVRLEAAAGIRLFVPSTSDPLISFGEPDEEWDAVFDSLALIAGEKTELIVEPEATDGSVLAGEPLVDFACETPGIVELVRPARRPARYALQGLARGSAACTIQALGFSQRFQVNVANGQAPQPDAGPDARADAQSDASPADAGDEPDGEAQ